MSSVILSIKGRQYVASEGQELLVDFHKEGEVDITVVGSFDSSLSSSKVTCSIVERCVKGDKVIAFKKRRRKHHQKKIGHRQKMTKIKIDSVS